MGVRAALGASRGDLLQLVHGRGLRLALAGIALGTLASLGLGPSVESLLAGSRRADLATLALVAAFLATIAALASYLPARRAGRVDPCAALREE
ncbi:MAG TPA: FtsX-like permease family protein [Thermoanaerobaculia bacterium]|nr:FtsX-like permease family protein [Thermoanaerobaculia bacterium]